MSAPEPLTPPDCDLRGMAYMPLAGNRLLTSTFDGQCNDSEWRAGVTLWCQAWQQVPAGSLPSDDAPLARLAGFGRDVKGWLKVKAHALHGFVLCSDGRLYHRVLCEFALEGWRRRVLWREKKQKQRRGSNGGHDGDFPLDVPEHVPRDTVGDTPDITGGTAGGKTPQGKGKGKASEEASSDPDGSVPAEPSPCQQAFDAWNNFARQAGLSVAKTLNGQRKSALRQRLAECGGIEGWLAAIEKVRNNPWLQGENDRAWRADLDFLLQAKSFTRLIEGGYDRSKPNGGARQDDGFL